ncbi:unnamed protein product, partial [Discosporangium mesarthrocarpum]
RVPNLWLPVAHSSSVTTKPLKIEVDGIPIVLWRSPTGEVSAISDVCIHRGASLARGWTSGGRLVCPYHGFEFDGDGRLAHMPGITAPSSESDSAVHSCDGRRGGRGRGGRASPAYAVKERGGWIHIFPDELRPGSIEQHRDPLMIPEATNPGFRVVEGTVGIAGSVEACVENMLDLLHISYVHSFGNLQNPVPFSVEYEEGFDDPESRAVATSRVTFRYRSGPRAFSKVIGRTPEV